MDLLTDLFHEGVDMYWAGEIPEGWEAKDAWRDPKIAGWLLSADLDNQVNHFEDYDDEY